MNVDNTSSDLLTKLGSVTSPARVSGGPNALGNIASAGFETMLREARGGGISSNLPVKLGAGLEDGTFDQEQLNRLATAADKAQASGAVHAVVLLDGKAWQLDVTGRTITGSAVIPESGVLEGIDAVIDAGGNAGADAFQRAGTTAKQIGLDTLSFLGDSARDAASRTLDQAANTLLNKLAS